MATTKQIRAIIEKHKFQVYATNKTKGHTGPDRRIKMYSHGTPELIQELQQVAGPENVKVLDWTEKYGPYFTNKSIVVKCVIA